MSIDWWTLGLQTINALVLIWLMARFLFHPVSQIIAERRAAAAADLDRAAEAQTKAEEFQRRIEAEKAELHAQRAALLNAAQSEAAEEKARLLSAARTEADMEKTALQTELDQMRRAARKGAAAELTALAATIARRLMARLPDTVRVTPFLPGLTKAMDTLPRAERDRIGADTPAALVSCRPLTEEETIAVQSSLRNAVGRPVPLRFETDPDLIAGLELRAPTATVRNHLAADLDRITAELVAHDK